MTVAKVLGTMTSVVLPIIAISEANSRDHWATKAKRVRLHRMAAKTLCPAYPLPCLVRLVRIAPRALDDDNNASALKATRDGIADKLGVNDRDPRVKWEYAQEKGKPAGVLVEFMPMELSR